MKKILLIAAMGLAGFAATSAHAESSFVVGGGATATAIAKLNIRVIIPRVLFLGVGTGAAATSPATVTTVDDVTFDYTTNPTDIGTGAAAPAGSITNTGGFTSAALPVRVFGNNGQITITASNSANLVNTATPVADIIPFTQITGTSSSTALAHPALSGGTANPTLSTSGSTKVTNQSADWTYAYLNTATPAAGTYTGQITYTASMP